jgi:hypothetical protein
MPPFVIGVDTVDKQDWFWMVHPRARSCVISGRGPRNHLRLLTGRDANNGAQEHNYSY